MDHAGETGAIQIYKAQIAVSTWLYPDLVPQLREMLAHEKIHLATFDTLLKQRNIRTCYALALWAIGGYPLGTLTAILGRNSIRICTQAIEFTVLTHLEEQLEFLKHTDLESYEAVLSIKNDEEAHQRWGEENQKSSVFYRPIHLTVSLSTAFAIWLSTKL